MSDLRDTAEWAAAMNALIVAIDLPDHLLAPIRDLIDPGLGRVFFDFWVAENDGGSSVDLDQKWRVCAEAWYDVYGISACHIVDWLIVARQTDQPWLRNLDERGHPKKLVKCGSLNRLIEEANKGLRHRNANADVGIGPDDESVIADLGAGHTLVLMISRKALRHEGRRMHHCIGYGGYDSHIEHPDFHLLSVRNPDGKPLATLEIRGATVKQVRGPCNADPLPAVVDLVAPIADAYGWTGFEEATRGRYWPYDRDALRVLEGLPPVIPRPQNRRRI
jgi:hypothetical protein